MTTFAVLGGGGWGTAVALLLAQNPAHRVRLWCARAESARQLRDTRQNERLLPGVPLPHAPMTTYRLDFGPEWVKGVVTIEPPTLGAPFVSRVPAVDEAGNGRGGIRLPQIAVPLATHTGWNYRRPSIGAPDRLASEIGSYLPLPKTRADRERTGDGRRSIAERYASREVYLERITTAARDLVQLRYLLASDVDGVVTQAAAHWDWATGAKK